MHEAMMLKEASIKAAVQEEEWLRELEELEQMKRDLTLEMKLLGQREVQAGQPGVGVDNAFLLKPDIVPAFTHSDQAGVVNLSITLGIDAAVVGVILQADGLFDNGNMVVFNETAADPAAIAVPIKTAKNQAVPIHAKCVVGQKGSSLSAVHDLKLNLPAFAAMRAHSFADSPLACDSSVRLPIRYNSVEAQIALWLETSFIAPSPLIDQDGNLGLMLSRGSIPVEINFFAENGTEIHVRTPSLELATDLVQSMLSFTGLQDVASEAIFPLELDALRALLKKVDGLNSARQRLSADIAEKSELAKGLLFQAEDRRELQEFSEMQDSYQNLFNLNRDLLAQYSMRCSNQTELVASVKAINLYIQRAARLRVGPIQTQIIQGCRAAFKANDVPLLMKLIQTGKP